ncbi:SAM-dependent methyltransferase [Rubellicoccus peritrichatus]|uniref:Class I SAM-dependent methyltransferase n=1 Tax=Rubellicoccus peritrichatus TaxID=3080537 RepID=A0AAQ3L8C5_9BACT|nr:class I SAM-dependent methyltransferase [Puniceicoccus sp. CR14]WOO41534.1 class I SAM-dependent methyltransferase [Puniceicoccus sp. CR14]
MDLECRLVKSYLGNRLSLPGPLLQLLLNSYVFGAEKWHQYRGTEFPAPEASDAIADETERLMQLHYDMPRGLFEGFLGKTMKYSMGLWGQSIHELDKAQETMLADVCKKARIGGPRRILDIGCGFGSFCSYVLKNYPEARITGLTLSKTQADYIREKQQEHVHPLSSDRFQLVQADFANWQTEETFDRIISIGVMEHIANLVRANQKIASMLTPDGFVFHHYITYRPYRKDQQRPRQNGFINQCIFPGGRNRAFSEQVNHPEPFELISKWFMKGTNYRQTVEAWLNNFQKNRKRIAVETGLDRSTLKLWDFYLRCSISIFKLNAGKTYGNGQYLLARE